MMRGVGGAAMIMRGCDGPLIVEIAIDWESMVVGRRRRMIRMVNRSGIELKRRA